MSRQFLHALGRYPSSCERVIRTAAKRDPQHLASVESFLYREPTPSVKHGGGTAVCKTTVSSIWSTHTGGQPLSTFPALRSNAITTGGSVASCSRVGCGWLRHQGVSRLRITGNAIWASQLDSLTHPMRERRVYAGDATVPPLFQLAHHLSCRYWAHVFSTRLRECRFLCGSFAPIVVPNRMHPLRGMGRWSVTLHYLY